MSQTLLLSSFNSVTRTYACELSIIVKELSFKQTNKSYFRLSFVTKYISNYYTKKFDQKLLDQTKLFAFSKWFLIIHNLENSNIRSY